MKLKKKIAIIFIFILLILIVYQVRVILSIKEIKKGDLIIPFKISGLVGEKIISMDICPMLIVLYRSSCPHCRYELDQLNENINKIKGINIFLLTPESLDEEIDFINKFQKLKNSLNVTWGTINLREVTKKYGLVVFPTILFFNDEGKLEGKWKGETKFENILKGIRMYLVPEQGGGDSAHYPHALKLKQK